MNIVRTLRNNWKKSLFAFGALSYGANWSYNRYQANQIRQFYCRKALQLGSQTLPSMTHATRIAVLLNGQANNGKAKSIYDKTVLPLLNLIGLDVRVYRLDTQTEPKALEELLTNKIEPNALSAIVIVGGDGTLSELAPYFLRSDVLQKLPICLIPIAEHASFARSLFPTTKKKKLHDDIGLLCEAVFSLFYGTVVQKPLLKITKSTDNQPIYASTLDFGHYSRLEQLQKRLWYFSYLKYPISSIYHYITNSVNSILSPEQPSITYSNPCSGCLRCRPSLLEQYRVSQQEKKPTFFSRLYQSQRSTAKPAQKQQIVVPTENPDCGVEYCINSDKPPVQLWIKTNNTEPNIQVDVSDKLERFNYKKETYPKQSMNVQRIRFNPKSNLLEKQMFINHEKLDMKKEQEQGNNDSNNSIEYRIELSDIPLKFIQLNNDLLLIKQPIYDRLEEEALEKKGIFLFSHHH